MPVGSEARVDFNSQPVQQYLCSMNESYQEPDDKELMSKLDVERRAEYPFPFDAHHVKAYTVLKRKYNMLLNKTVIARPEVTCPVEHAIDLSLKGVLMVSKKASEPQKALMEKIFLAYDYKINPDMEAYAQEEAAKNGLKGSDFYITFPYNLKKIGSPRVDESQDKALKKWAEKNKFTLRLVSETCSHLLVGEPSDKDGVIEVGDESDSEKKIGDDLKEREKINPCESKNKIIKKVTDLIPWPELKTETECHWEENFCFKTRVCIDVPYTRLATPHLYAGLIYPDGAKAFEKIMEKCLYDSAITSTVVGLVLEDIGAAIVAFEALFIDCVTRHAVDLIECLDATLFLTVTRSGWKKVF